MQVFVKGRHIDVGDALRGYVEEKLASAVAKYFEHAIDGNVVFSKSAHLYRADCSVHVGSGITVKSQADAGDIHASFDTAAERIEKQLRRYKRRLRDHHNARKSKETDENPASYYILAPEAEDEPEVVNDQPMIIAEETTGISTLTVSEAVMRMDLGDLSALMFHNSAHGGLNMVYRRGDGNIGWIDPQGGDS